MHAVLLHLYHLHISAIGREEDAVEEREEDGKEVMELAVENFESGRRGSGWRNSRI